MELSIAFMIQSLMLSLGFCFMLASMTIIEMKFIIMIMTRDVMMNIKVSWFEMMDWFMMSIFLKIVSSMMHIFERVVNWIIWCMHFVVMLFGSHFTRKFEHMVLIHVMLLFRIMHVMV